MMKNDQQSHSKAAFLPTLFDRLVDNEPTKRLETSQVYTFDAQGMREIIKRDLALLLNTTNISDELDESRFSVVASSVVNYGVPALSGSYMAERSWSKVEAMIRQAIIRFEPRLISDALVIMPSVNSKGSCQYNILMFEIKGLVQWSPYPIEFRLKSHFDLETSQVRLQQV
ncbi:type VI secretion system baseplate subunit TssE [Neisseriaceae bacterium TC5R-5]|nr:type VI secretion system baseplate subunit TssE [Neisseriaceae bacterium TC5R-5]